VGKVSLFLFFIIISIPVSISKKNQKEKVLEKKGILLLKSCDSYKRKNIFATVYGFSTL
jgi:hypothetical protein